MAEEVERLRESSGGGVTAGEDDVVSEMRLGESDEVGGDLEVDAEGVEGQTDPVARGKIGVVRMHGSALSDAGMGRTAAREQRRAVRYLGAGLPLPNRLTHI
jgi:hypothetical protein